MKKLVSVCLFVCSIFLFNSCEKTDIASGTSKNYSDINNVPINTGGTFSFTKITISPNPVKIGIASKLIATATGSNLTYKWSTSHGDLFGTGSAIYYSDSCIGEYSITCTVSDGKNTATLTVPITISN